jgi:AcrR family transcriptional regulator
MSRGLSAEHDAVQRAIADAACRLVGQSGVEALTFRRVAAEADVSPGRVQHYFPGRSELVHAAFDLVQERARDRVTSVLGGIDQPSGRDVLDAVLRAVIPQTSDELAELRVIATFETLALTEPAIRDALRTGHQALVDLLTGQVGGAAVQLLATAEGLAGQALRDQIAPDDALAVLDAAVTSALGPSLAGQP